VLFYYHLCSIDTVFLIIRSGNDCMCVDRIEDRYPIRALTIDGGVSRPLGIGAGSLARMTRNRQKRVAESIICHAGLI
jgi:DNA-binding IclR family transcriptional regulator